MEETAWLVDIVYCFSQIQFLQLMPSSVYYQEINITLTKPNFQVTKVSYVTHLLLFSYKQPLSD